MSDTSREHRPLLHEDVSDEDFQQDYNPPLRRHMGYKGKARNTAKGAAAILKNWPDHWSSSVIYWWIGIGMFALMTFVLYSSVVTYSLLPAADSSPIPHIIEKHMALPDIFMHVFVNNEKETVLNKYLPYVQIFADKYLHYKFNLIVVLNDTFGNKAAIREAQTNNEDAMNSLWTDYRVHEIDSVTSKSKSNINIQYVNLSNYLDDSPLRQFWKELPYQLIEFLVRAVSIWDKGGVAFSPIILTPKSPDAIYIEKLYTLLSSYEENKKPNLTMDTYKTQYVEKSRVLNNHKNKFKKKVNNIRDIIDDLEMDTLDHESLPEALSVAESKQELIKLKIQSLNDDTVLIENTEHFNVTGKLVEDHIKDQTNKSNNKSNRSEILNYMLPSFLDFLFHNNPNTTTQEDSTATNSLKRTSRAIAVESTQGNSITNNVKQPMIISAPTNFIKASPNIEKSASRIIGDVDNLTIDLKGNMLATQKSCHAFLGSMFSNVKHRTEDVSLKDFIIAELSLFCNGLLSTCKGIDVILL